MQDFLIDRAWYPNGSIKGANLQTW